MEFRQCEARDSRQKGHPACKEAIRVRGTGFHGASNPILLGISALPGGTVGATDSYHLDVLGPHVSPGPEADTNLRVSMLCLCSLG